LPSEINTISGSLFNVLCAASDAFVRLIVFDMSPQHKTFSNWKSDNLIQETCILVILENACATFDQLQILVKMQKNKTISIVSHNRVICLKQDKIMVKGGYVKRVYSEDCLK
jgi:hypothetical protein